MESINELRHELKAKEDLIYSMRTIPKPKVVEKPIQEASSMNHTRQEATIQKSKIQDDQEPEKTEEVDIHF